MTWRGTICLLLALGATTARGEESTRTKLGFEFRGFRTVDTPEVGWLAALNYGWFIGKSDAYLGLAAHYGSPNGNNPSQDNLFYGGGIVGYDGKFSRSAVYELRLLVGYGRGRMTGVQETSYYVAEPSLAAGFALGLGFRLLFTGSYLHMSRTQFSGISFGIRIDRRYDTRTRPVDP